MKKMPKFKKSNLLTPAEREKIIRESSEKANLIVTICVLADCNGVWQETHKRVFGKLSKIGGFV